MIVDGFQVILRVCDKVVACNSARDLQDDGMFSKLDVIKRTAGPLYLALKRYLDETKKRVDVMCVLDDCSPETEQIYSYFSGKHGISTKLFKSSNKLGNGGSFLVQCGIAKQCPENVIAFFLEDDYLVVDPTMFCVVDEAFEKFGVDGINPHWHPKGGCGRVGDAKPDFVSGGVSFGRIDNSCCTFAVRSQLFRENEKDFLNYGRTCRENEAFNPVWARSRFYGVFNGTMMEHLHRCELSGAGAIKAVNPK